MRTLAICIALILHYSYPHVYVQLHLNSVLNATPNLAATSLHALYISHKHSTLLIIADFSITYYMIRLTALLSSYFHTGTAINKLVSDANMYIPPIYSLEIGNDIRQWSILSPYLFSRYNRHLIFYGTNYKVGCCIAGIFYNILSYANDMVLLAPRLRGLQSLIMDINQLSRPINVL
jgi:hypothetical protein